MIEWWNGSIMVMGLGFTTKNMAGFINWQQNHTGNDFSKKKIWNSWISCEPDDFNVYSEIC